MKYSALIEDHFANPRNNGALADATHAAEAVNEACMDCLKIYALVDQGTVTTCTFQAQGCVPVLALGSWLTGFATGKSVRDLHFLTIEQVETAIGGLPRSKKHAAHLVVEVLQKL